MTAPHADRDHSGEPVDLLAALQRSIDQAREHRTTMDGAATGRSTGEGAASGDAADATVHDQTDADEKLATIARLTDEWEGLTGYLRRRSPSVLTIQNQLDRREANTLEIVIEKLRAAMAGPTADTTAGGAS